VTRAARLFLVALLLAAPARAGQKGSVVIWAPPDDHLAVRLRAELEAAGLFVMSTATPPNVTRAAIEGAGKELGARAIVRFLPGTTEVHVWAIDASGAATLREVAQVEGASAPEEDVAVRRAAELVRASVDEREPPPPDVGPAPAPPPPAPPRFAVALGPAVFASAGGVSLSAALSGEWLALDRVAVRAFALAPITAARVEDAEGNARVRTFGLGAGARVYLAAPVATWRPHVGAGLGLGGVQIDGSANAPYVSLSSDKLAAIAYGAAGLTFALGPRLALAAEALVGGAAPQVAVRFASREVATWGRPIAMGSLAGVVSW
jgi:hypothetical protein